MPIISARSFLMSLATTCAIAGSTVLIALSQTPSPTASPATKPEPTLIERLDKEFEKHQIPALIAIAAGLGYLGVLWLKPLWLLKLPSTSLSLPWTNWKVPLGVIKPLKYRNRVLDTWVEGVWQEAEANFFVLPTVDDRKIHISLPVRLGRELVEPLTGETLVSTFKKKPAILLVTGEGGSGKTSLACQIARWGLEQKLAAHRMLPVLVETELDDKRSLVEVIRGQLSALTNQPEPISIELLEKLLQRQRVLVIVDHLSEMSEGTRKQITPELLDFPAKALIVTSRLDESLGGILKTVLRPLQIKPDQLWRFMSDYLESLGKRELFNDDDYAAACERLRLMASGDSITVLLARLYIDHMIREQQGAGGILPDSVPKLMLSYVNQLNRNIDPAKKQPDLDVQRDAKTIAWKCLEQTYRPTAIKKEVAIATLANHGAADKARERLEYLENRLQILQSPDPGDRTRIILDPLAEYLAAADLVERYCQEDEPEMVWRDFLKGVDEKLEQGNETSEVIRGFLLALRNCCLDNWQSGQIPGFVTEELAHRAGLDPEELRQEQEKRRIRKLILELSAPELEFRIEAAEKLSRRGAPARMAEANLVGMLENRGDQPTEARQAAAQALGKLGIGCDRLLMLLTDRNEDVSVRRSAAEALGLMKAGRAELLRILESDTEPIQVRQGAARAINQIGAPSGEAVPMLIVKLQDNQIIGEAKSISVWHEALSEEVTLNLVSIPGGEFLMGSPLDEEGRDWYQTYYPDTEGLDVEGLQNCTLFGTRFSGCFGT